MFRKLIILMLAAMLAMIGIGSATTFYVIYNIPVAWGSTGNLGDVVDFTDMPSSAIDGNWTLLRIYEATNLAVSPKYSRLSPIQWNDTEMASGGWDGALALYQIDEFQDMR